MPLYGIFYVDHICMLISQNADINLYINIVVTSCFLIQKLLGLHFRL